MLVSITDNSNAQEGGAGTKILHRKDLSKLEFKLITLFDIGTDNKEVINESDDE